MFPFRESYVVCACGGSPSGCVFFNSEAYLSTKLHLPHLSLSPCVCVSLSLCALLFSGSFAETTVESIH